MIAFPNCKINLGLRILRKRSDGYHDLETVFYPLPFYEAVEIIRSKNSKTSFNSSGLPVDAIPDHNLCVRAYGLLKKDFTDLPPVQIHLHKAIPSGAGLGGGSADGAFVLKLLNTKFNLGISEDRLLEYALKLGSDGPFFIMNKACYATGRGEILEPLPLDLTGYSLIIVNPGIHISTAKAFSGISPSTPVKSTKGVIQQPIDTWKNELINDFENVVFKDYPVIKTIKEDLYANGAVYASLSGSGSTLYGIFKKGTEPHLSFPENYFIKYLVS